MPRLSESILKIDCNTGRTACGGTGSKQRFCHVSCLSANDVI